MNNRSINISDRCVGGHSANKHIGKFNDLGVETPEQYKNHINNVLESRETECFSAYSTNQTWRQADYFYHEPTNTMVVAPENPNHEPTAYRPKNGREAFDEKHKEAEGIEGRDIEKYHGIDELEHAKQSKATGQSLTSEQAPIVETDPALVMDQNLPEVAPTPDQTPSPQEEPHATPDQTVTEMSATTLPEPEAVPSNSSGVSLEQMKAEALASKESTGQESQSFSLADAQAEASQSQAEVDTPAAQNVPDSGRDDR